MANVNKVLLLGNLTRDPEVRYTPKGTAIAEISLAINRYRKADDGSKQEEVTFVDVVLWGRTAEIAQQYTSKGNPVFIEGRLKLDQWDDTETGKKRSRLRVVAENLQLLPKSGGAPQNSPQPETRSTTPPKPAADFDNDDDDIPF